MVHLYCLHFTGAVMDEVAGKRFEDSTLAKKAKFFIYAPPLITQRKSKRPSPNAPFKNAERWQTSIYYLWWLYLRRSDAYKATCKKGGKGRLAKLYADFGDVFDDKETEKDTFWSWWKTHAHLFWEPAARQVAETKDTVDAEETDLVVRLALEVRTAHIIKQVRRLLRENEAKVKQARAKSRAKYPVRNKVKLTSLHKHLRVYDAFVANQGKKLHEIADIAGLRVDERIEIFDSEGDSIGLKSLSWIDKNGYRPAYQREIVQVIRRRKRQIARQHIIAAKEYIACVEQGYFPCRSILK